MPEPAPVTPSAKTGAQVAGSPAMPRVQAAGDGDRSATIGSAAPAAPERSAAVGYHGCYLRIDASAGDSGVVAIAEPDLRRFLGGVGLGTLLLAREAPSGADLPLRTDERKGDRLPDGTSCRTNSL